MAESIYYDSLKVSKSKCQFIWREWRGGNGGALIKASRSLRGLQKPPEDFEVRWQPLHSLWGSPEASKKVRRFRRAISATWFDTLILTLSKSHSRLTTSFYHVAMVRVISLPHSKMLFYHVAMVRVISLPHGKMSLPCGNDMTLLCGFFHYP